MRAVGFRGLPVPGLPWDATTATVPHEGGRVAPGAYVAGWIKRGPSGFIGTNKSCAQETVSAILDDLDAGLPEPVGTRASIASVVAQLQPDVVDLAGWQAIDGEERRRGEVRGRPRAKIVDREALLRVARARPTGARRYAAELLRSALLRR